MKYANLIPFAALILLSIAFAADCEQTSIYQYYGGGNNTTSSIVMELRNSNTEEGCAYGKFNITATIPDRIGDMSDINYSMPPSKISGRQVTWTIFSLDPGEWLTIKYSVPRYVVPRVQRELSDPTFAAYPQTPTEPEELPSLDSKYFKYKKIEASPGNYFIYSSGKLAGVGEEKNVGNQTQIIPIDDPEKIMPALSRNIGRGKEDAAKAALQEAHRKALLFRSAAREGEAACRVLMGTDRSNCTSMDECQYACYSVTSFCYPIAIGSGKDFIALIWQMENLTKQLDEKMAVENSAYENASKNMTPESLEAYRLALVGINSNAAQVMSNSLIFWLCPAPDYDFAGLTDARERLSFAAEDYSAYYAITDDAAKYALFAWESNEFAKLKAEKEAAAKAAANETMQNVANISAPEQNQSNVALNETAEITQNASNQTASAPVQKTALPELPKGTNLIALVVGALVGAIVLGSVAIFAFREMKKKQI